MMSSVAEFVDHVCVLIQVLKVLRALGLITCKGALHIRFEKLCLQFTIV
jgi:hypothetical protein